MPRTLSKPETPAPGEHDPNFNYVKKRKPEYSFGAPFRDQLGTKTPAPNTYCERKVYFQFY